MKAGFRLADEYPMVWVAELDEEGGVTFRVPNASSEQGPLAAIPAHDGDRWWMLADVTAPGVSGPQPARLACSVRLDDAEPVEAFIGFRDDDARPDGGWDFQSLGPGGDSSRQAKLVKGLGEQSDLYLKWIDSTRAHDQVRSGILGTLQIYWSANPPSDVELTRTRRLPRSEWLQPFDDRHTAALESSVAQTRDHVSRRIEGDPSLAWRRRGVAALRGAQVGVPTLVASGATSIAAKAYELSHAAPDQAVPVAALSAVAYLAAAVAPFIAQGNIRNVRAGIGGAVGLGGPGAPSDHPLVTRRVGYGVLANPSDAANHTLRSISRIARGGPS